MFEFGETLLVTSDDGKTEDVVVVDHFQDVTADEFVIQYDWKLNEQTLEDMYPHNPSDTVVVCLYPSQVEELPLADKKRVKSMIKNNKVKPYYFHSSRFRLKSTI